jgi:hypothetical protein
VATVNSSGLVTALAAGSATITVTTQQGGFTANAAITVTGGGGTTITVNGSLSDWSNVPAIATASGQTSTSLKVFSNSTTLYFGVAGSGMSATDYQIFINADNNTATGYQDNVFTGSGADYMIENGTFYKSTGTAWGWTSATATIQVSKNSSVTELSINRSAFSGPALSSTIRAAYKDMVNWATVSKLPSSGAFPAYTLQAGRIAVSQSPETSSGSAERTFFAYPNPTNGEAIQLEYVISERSNVEVKLFDNHGMEAYSKNLGTQEKGIQSHVIEASSLAKGFYIIRLSAGADSKFIKVIHN